MNLLGNLIWIIFGGLTIALGYIVAGFVLCLTIIGIPFGIQAFKIGIFAFLPFGQTTVVTEHNSGCLATFMNILWILIGGIWLAIAHVLVGIVMCVTIIGIPFGLQHFKLAAVALTPFGRTIVSC